MPEAAQADASGGAWYATHLGPLHIAAAPVSPTEAPPPVIIERVAVDGTSQDNRTSVALQPSTRNLEIEASPVLLSSRTGLRLRRRLFGLESQWTEIAPGAASIYGKLPPGRYIFRVEANWPNQKEISSAQIIIVQQSSIYRRPWFIALCGIAICLLIWLYHQLQRRQMSLRFHAVMMERTRVAREIHDTILQGCIGISALLEAVASSHEQQGIRDEGSRWLQLLYYAREQIKQTIHEARNAIWELRSPDAGKPLDSALRDVIERLPHHDGLLIAFKSFGPAPAIDPPIQQELMMAVREAVLNAIAHAGASRIDVHRTSKAAEFFIEVSDNGSGFLPAEVAQQEGHFGVVSMRERIERIGGQFTIDSILEQGTVVRIRLSVDGAKGWRSQ